MRKRLPRWLRWKMYEAEKRKLNKLKLSPEEYVDRIRELAQRLRV